MEELTITGTDKKSVYEEILPQLEALMCEDFYEISNLANVSAVLKEAFGFYWVGFYLVRNQRLELGPFQGPLACSVIRYGKGVCGTSWAEKKTMLVPDVDKFPGHIACSSKSRSEIVVPLIKENGDVYAVLDIDSDKLDDFDDIDRIYLEKLAKIICKKIK